MSARFEALRELAREAPVEVGVRGDCMAPLFAGGDRVRVAAARFYAPGDVVVFRAAGGGLVAHRLLGYRLHAGSLALVTRGDACPAHDAPVPLAALRPRTAEGCPFARMCAEESPSIYHTCVTTVPLGVFLLSLLRTSAGQMPSFNDGLPCANADDRSCSIQKRRGKRLLVTGCEAGRRAPSSSDSRNGADLLGSESAGRPISPEARRH